VADPESARIDRFFTEFATRVAKWTGSHRAVAVVGVLVGLSLAFFGVETTALFISIVTLLMVFVLQNTQNRDSAALHLKLDEIVLVEPDARNDVRGVESKPEPEIRRMNGANPSSLASEELANERTRS
jgi:low affinity Fe/Cu permease